MNELLNNDLFTGIEEKWTESDSETAPLLVDVVNGFRDNNLEKELEKRLDLHSLSIFPFHHLISVAKLSTAFSKLPPSLVRPQTIGEAEKRRQIFWETLAGQDVPANEASLFDDSIWCRFIDLRDEEFVETNWEVMYFDELQGSAELYRAEMLAFKRRVYEAGNDLRAVLELKDLEILRYLPREKFAIFETEDIQRLFLDNLIAPFSLTFSKSGEIANKIAKIADKDKRRKKSAFFADIFGTYVTYSANRMESCTSKEAENDEEPLNTPENATAVKLHNHFVPPVKPGENYITESGRTTYRLRLTKYWLNWQKDAYSAGFDFNFIETIEDSRQIRFYELTKLLRAQSISKGEDKLSDKLEIEYDKFISLMPLPQFRSEREINAQIKLLIKPLKASGYVKSFVLKPDWRGLNAADRVVFRFRD